MTTVTALAGPYEYTATNLLGDKRETMLHNELHLRKELGRSFERGYIHYPGSDALYGRPYPPSDGGAGEALRGWPKKCQNKETAMSLPAYDRDFLKLNRAAIQRGLTTAHEMYEFRTQHDIPKKPALAFSRLTSGGVGHRIDPSMVYGMPTRPSTPIHDLLEHKFQDQWLKERFQIMSSRIANKDVFLRPGQVNETRASMIRRYQEPVEKPNPWKMPKFENKAKPALETFRSAEAKSRAYRYFSSDSVPRRGQFGHGIPEPAQF